ncbi:conserved phage C-terminal domain-containing protein [Ectobacillus antri]|uniref:conserved phage C-terminal domain-containing protein n=1 Tax=Ectobacillus antri TaxID=2486280 RepID=UPI001FE61CFD|nr:conserved phage C-terminal domain-containing protein [Ectobacillus antri]
MNSKVFEINALHFHGNIIDDGWFLNIRKGKKPYMLAIMILGEIVYWYRPTVSRDEETDQTVFKQKFKADKLQRSYKQFAQKYDVSRDVVKAACDHLVEMKLITTEFRTIVVNGSALNNVMFVEPVPEEIKKISISYMALQDTRPRYQKSEETPLENTTTLPLEIGGDSPEKSEETPLENRRTYTEITTESSTKNSTDIKSKKNSPDIRPSTPAPTGQSSTSSIDKPKEKNTIPFAEIVNYLNEQAITDYKATSKEIQRLIRARWKDGYRVEDFKKVIDTKVAEWLNDPKMNMYLRPSTLFGNKFTDYHGQRPVRKGVVKYATPQQQHSRYAGDNDVKLPF